MLIEIKDLKKTFTTDEVETKVLHGLSFTVDKGEFISLMGPSGSGKSTLMHILGFLDRPTDGTYIFEGKKVKNFDDDELALLRNEKVGFVFQAFYLLPRTTVFENVQLPLLYAKTQEERIEELVHSAIRSVGLEHRTNYFSNQLSGGEKQRVAIARALVNDPDVIFADEPTGNLDSKSGIGIMRILQDLNTQGKTIILVTHETYTSEHGKRIVKLRDGRIVDDYGVKKRRFADKENILK